MKTRMLAGCFALSLLLGLPSLGHSQSYSLDWWTIDGGGGTSTGGAFSLTGTIGQPDAGTLTGGNFTLQGGFWGIISAVQTPGAPLLSVLLSNNTVIISWPSSATGFILQQTTTLNGTPVPWAQVAFPYQTNASTIYITVPPPPAGNDLIRPPRYFRLRNP